MAFSISAEKSREFAVRIARLCKHLRVMRGEDTLSNQLLRSGTSIGANIHEAIEATSDKEFVYRMGVALKEASETDYWLYVLHEAGYLTQKEFESIYPNCIELKKMLAKTINTKKANMAKKLTVES